MAVGFMKLQTTARGRYAAGKFAGNVRVRRRTSGHPASLAAERRRRRQGRWGSQASAEDTMAGRGVAVETGTTAVGDSLAAGDTEAARGDWTGCRFIVDAPAFGTDACALTQNIV